MKTIRLLYPDYLGGGLDSYYFGANLLAHLVPQNLDQPLIKVEISPPDNKERKITKGIYALDEVLEGISNAQEKLRLNKPDKIITLGGNCLVSLAPFDYLHGKYKNLGILWIDAHPDVSSVDDNYPNAHAMVLGALMGECAKPLVEKLENPKFKGSEILYLGLQKLHDYQENFLKKMGVNYQIQEEDFLSEQEIKSFLEKFEQVVIHFDIDVMNERFFHSTYFANPKLKGDGSGGGKMTMEKVQKLLSFIEDNSEIVGFSIAEYLPFDEHNLNKMLSGLKIFN